MDNGLHKLGTQIYAFSLLWWSFPPILRCTLHTTVETDFFAPNFLLVITEYSKPYLTSFWLITTTPPIHFDWYIITQSPLHPHVNRIPYHSILLPSIKWMPRAYPKTIEGPDCICVSLCMRRRLKGACYLAMKRAFYEQIRFSSLS